MVKKASSRSGSTTLKVGFQGALSFKLTEHDKMPTKKFPILTGTSFVLAAVVAATAGNAVLVLADVDGPTALVATDRG